MKKNLKYFEDELSRLSKEFTEFKKKHIGKPEIGKAILRGEEPSITSADLHLIQEGKYTRTWQEGSGNPHKKWMRCGFETDQDYNYCTKCGGRI